MGVKWYLPLLVIDIQPDSQWATQRAEFKRTYEMGTP
jgi:hypothetical protein